MKKIALAFLVLLLVLSCGSDDCGCTNLDRHVDIAVIDSEGNFLINSDNFYDIDITYLINGDEENGEAPLFIEGEYPRVRLFLNNYGELPITYIKWNALDTDTIKATFTNNNTLLQKAWINEILLNEPTEQYFYYLIK